MPKLNVYNLEAKEVREIDLAEAVFGIEPNHQVMFDAIVMQRASMRQGTHDTKTRHEVSGGGRKPWRQKGTGRARQGSTRSPQWRGGGVAFKGGKQRYAALRSHHARNRVIRSWQLLRVAEIQAFLFQRAQFRREIRECFVIKIGSLETFAVDINQVEFRVRDSFRRLFIISRQVRVAIA